MVDDARIASHVQDRLPVVFELAARRDADYSHNGDAIVLHPTGDFNAHQLERPGQLVPEVRHAGRAPAFAGAVLLVQDRIPVIERVE